MSAGPEEVYAFGAITVDVGAHTVRRDGVRVELAPRSFDLLVTLVRNAGRMLSKEELLNHIWPEVFVEEGSLARNISTLRTALGDQGGRYIETVPRLGYRFAAPVERVGVQPSQPQIAVLPFAQRGGEDGGHLGFGLADSLIGALSRARSLVVRPTSAVLRYESRGEDVTAAGRELRVDYIVDGYIHAVEARLHVSVQLVDVRKAAVIWAERFDEAAGAMLLVQDAISARIADALAPRLSPGDQALLRQPGVRHPEAFPLYVRGRYVLSKYGHGREAIESFRRAVDLDPGYALAYAGLADASMIAGPAGALDVQQGILRAKAAAAKALDLHPNLGEARTTIAMLRFWEDWDRRNAEPDYLKALDLSPNYPLAHHAYAWYLTAVGRFSEAETTMRKAAELDPLSPAIAADLALPLYFSRDYDNAIQRLERLDLDPRFWYRDYLLAQTCAQSGRFAAAFEIFQRASAHAQGPLFSFEVHACWTRALALSGQTVLASAQASELAASRPHSCGAYRIAGIHVALGDHGDALDWLETACREHEKWIGWIQVDPAFDVLRAEPRFAGLLQRCGFQGEESGCGQRMLGETGLGSPS